MGLNRFSRRLYTLIYCRAIISKLCESDLAWHDCKIDEESAIVNCLLWFELYLLLIANYGCILIKPLVVLEGLNFELIMGHFDFN